MDISRISRFCSSLVWLSPWPLKFFQIKMLTFLLLPPLLMFSNWFPVDEVTTTFSSSSHMGRNFYNLTDTGFSSNNIILLRSGRLSKPTIRLLNIFTRRCEIVLSHKNLSHVSLSYLYSSSCPQSFSWWLHWQETKEDEISWKRFSLWFW